MSAPEFYFLYNTKQKKIHIMNNKHIFFIALSIISLTIFSCKKKDEEEDTTTTTGPVITISINKPYADSIIDFEDTVHIDFSIQSNIDLHGYHAMLINVTAHDTVWESENEDHAMNYSLTDFWVNQVTDHSQMHFKVIAEIDHDGNTREKEVDFHCHPFE